MSAQENKQRLQVALDQVAAQDPGPFRDLLADDIVWTVIGTTRWSGTYRGKDDLLTRLLRPVRALLAPDFKWQVRRLVAEDDIVVAQLRGDNRTLTGRRYDNDYCWVCHMKDGKLVEVTEYADTALFAELLQ